MRLAFQSVTQEFGRDGDLGGYIFIQDTDSDYHGHHSVGTPDPDRKEKFIFFSKEKAERLTSNPDHRFSTETKDDKKEQYSGAVRDLFGKTFSFSGLPQNTDEALVLAAMVHAGIITRTDATDWLEELHPENVAHFFMVLTIVSAAL